MLPFEASIIVVSPSIAGGTTVIEVAVVKSICRQGHTPVAEKGATAEVPKKLYGFLVLGRHKICAGLSPQGWSAIIGHSANRDVSKGPEASFLCLCLPYRSARPSVKGGALLFCPANRNTKGEIRYV